MAEDKRVTIRDLQTFIDAVEFASDQEEWVPSAKQWKRIREMINKLEANPPAHHQTAPPQFQGIGPGVGFGPQATVTPALPMAAPSSLHGGMQMHQPVGPVNPLFGAGAVPVRTPDIDTTNGKPYQSGFA